MVDILNTLIGTSLVTIGLYFNYVYNSKFMYTYGIKFMRFLSGYNIKYISRKNGKGNWCYAEKCQNKNQLKKYPTLIMLHGFGADKDIWLQIARHIPNKYHCVIIDLPGHGETSFVDGYDELNFDSYVHSVKEFLEMTGLDKEPVYLIGCSFGGSVAGIFAHTFPENVAKLGLLCPAVKSPILTDTCKQILNGDYITLIPHKGEDVIKMLNLLSAKRAFYPVRIMDSFVELNYTSEKKELLKQLLDSIVANEFRYFEKFLNKMKRIESETLIIWGDQDEIVHVSGAQMLSDGIKNSKLVILKDCNHIIGMDKPIEATELLLKFLD